MASNTKKSGGDFVLESRHLVGLFLLLVVIFGVVFTLGYLMGRSQGDNRSRIVIAAPSEPKTSAAVPPPPKSKGKPEPPPEDTQAQKTNSDWDFYHSADPQANSDHLQPPPKAVAPPAPVSKPAPPIKAAKPGKATGGLGGPLIPKGTIMLQGAAVLED